MRARGEGESRSFSASPARQSAAGKEGTGDSAPFLRQGRQDDNRGREAQKSRRDAGATKNPRLPYQPQGLKPLNRGRFSARLKSCPDTNRCGHSPSAALRVCDVLCPYQRTPWPTRASYEAGSNQGSIIFCGWPRNLDIMGRIRSFGQSLLPMLLRKSDGLAGQS